MKSVSVADADLLRLLDEVANGETFVITKDDLPVAQLAPLSQVEHPKRRSSVVEDWERFRREHNLTLGDDLTIRQLIEEGRKY